MCTLVRVRLVNFKTFIVLYILTRALCIRRFSHVPYIHAAVYIYIYICYTYNNIGTHLCV